MKHVLSIDSAPQRHWVGDGFPVHGLFGYNGPSVGLRSPFLMLDYAAPVEFAPNTGYRRGVGAHPHRGFETVTIVYAGEVEHRDSTGAGGVIGPGDVQWMTAGSGIVHEEFHSRTYSATGGSFEIAQLWVNLPAKDKMIPPAYQGITAQQIPVVDVGGGGGVVRVVAGSLDGRHGPARTHTPMNVWDVRLADGGRIDLPQPDGWSTLLVVLAGSVRINGDALVRSTETATLSPTGRGVSLQALGDAKVLLLAGEPIDEPVVGYGPFVMNTQAEIRQAVIDYNSGKFGQVSSAQ